MPWKTTTADELRVGEVVRFGNSKASYRVQWIEWKGERAWLICYGPLESKSQQGGQAFFVRGRPYLKEDLASGNRIKVQRVEARAWRA